MSYSDELLTAVEAADEPSVERAAELTERWLARLHERLYPALVAAKSGAALTSAGVDTVLWTLADDLVSTIDEPDLATLDQAVGFNRIFDYTQCDPDLLNENLHAAYFAQMRWWLTIVFAEHLDSYLRENPKLMPEATALLPPRLSPLAEESTRGDGPPVEPDGPVLAAN
jgi:hypothetical protein